MRNYLIAGAALILTSTAALAQNSVTVIAPAPTVVTPAPTLASPPPPSPPGTTTTTTSTRNPMTGEVSHSRDQTTVDANGRQITRSDSVTSNGVGAAHSSTTKVTQPDGSTTAYHTKEWSGAPQ